jgi:NADH:ubiquinone oxidoreductase subunit E
MAVTAPLRWRCCDATACRAAGAAALRQRLEAEVGADREQIARDEASGAG